MAKLRGGKWEYTENELQRQVKSAVARGKRSAATKPFAVEAHYDRKEKRVVIRLNNGGVFSFPVELIKELSHASATEIAKMKLTPQGTAIHWDTLDAQYSDRSSGRYFWKPCVDERDRKKRRPFDLHGESRCLPVKWREGRPAA